MYLKNQAQKLQCDCKKLKRISEIKMIDIFLVPYKFLPAKLFLERLYAGSKTNFFKNHTEDAFCLQKLCIRAKKWKRKSHFWLIKILLHSVSVLKLLTQHSHHGSPRRSLSQQVLSHTTVVPGYSCRDVGGNFCVLKGCRRFGLAFQAQHLPLFKNMACNLHTHTLVVQGKSYMVLPANCEPSLSLKTGCF